MKWNILTIWRIRTIRSNLPRAVTNVLAVTLFFALMTWATQFYTYLTGGAKVDGDGAIRYFMLFAKMSAIPICTLLMFTLFCITILTNREEHRNLYACGSTVSQLLRDYVGLMLCLDLAGLLFGVGLGVLLTKVLLGSEYMIDDLQSLFSGCLPGMIGVVIAEITAGLYVLPRPEFLKNRYFVRDSLFRRGIIRRIFGVGGQYATVRRKRSIGPRGTLLASYVLAVAALPIMTGALQFFIEAQPRIPAQSADLYIDAFCKPTNRDFMPRVNTLLEANCSSGKIREMSCNRYYSPNIYCRMDDDCMSQAFRSAAKANRFVSRNYRFNDCFTFGDGMVLRNFVVAFLDNATFDALCDGTEVGKTDALLYDVGSYRGERINMVGHAPPETVDLYVQPDTFADDFAFLEWQQEPKTAVEPGVLRELDKTLNLNMRTYLEIAQKKSVIIPVHIAGVLHTDEACLFNGKCTLIFREGMRSDARFAAALAQYVRHLRVNLRTNDADALLEEWKQTMRADEKCDVVIHSELGLGNETQRRKGTTSKCFILNCAKLRDHLDGFKDDMRTVKVFFALFIPFILLTNTVNIVHMNNISRRRERLILDSIGMQRRQRVGMLLYESTLYSVRTVLYAILLFWVIYPFFCAVILRGLSFEWLASADMLSNGADLQWYEIAAADHRQILKMTWTTFSDCWWIFFGASALVFAVYFITDFIEGRRSDRDTNAFILQEEEDE